MWARLWRPCLLAGSLSHTTSALELTPDNWDEATEGKNVFIKFYAPWCGHCKRLKPDWDKLGERLEGSKLVTIGDVDCTSEGESLCGKYGISGYPSLKYGSTDDLQDYRGPRSFDALLEFVDKTFKAACSPSDRSICSEEELAVLDELLEEPLERLAEILAEKRQQESLVNNEFREAMKALAKPEDKQQEGRAAAEDLKERMSKASKDYSEAVKNQAKEMKAKQEERHTLLKNLDGKGPAAEVMRKWHKEMTELHEKHGKIIQQHQSASNKLKAEMIKSKKDAFSDAAPGSQARKEAESKRDEALAKLHRKLTETVFKHKTDQKPEEVVEEEEEL